MLWEKPGEDNTRQTLELAVQRAEQLAINNLVIASCSGATARELHSLAGPRKIVCVTHHNGFDKPGTNEMDDSTRQDLEKAGIRVLTTTHLLAGVDRGVRNHFGGVYPAEMIAQTLRMLGQGVKVSTEIAVMALDAGLVPYDEEIISIAGTIRGADVALVVKPAHANHFFDTEIREIICMPRTKKKV